MSLVLNLIEKVHVIYKKQWVLK